MTTFSTLITLSLCLFISSCKNDESRLQQSKEKSIEAFEVSAPLVLEKKTFQEITLPSKAPKESLKIPLENTIIVLPKPVNHSSRKKGPKGYQLIYPTFEVILFSMEAGNDLAKLPAKWGKDDLEKMRTLNTASQELIDQAANPTELKQAVELLTASSTLASVHALSGLLWVNTKDIQGLVTGKINKTKVLDFIFRANSPKQPENYRIIITPKPDCKDSEILVFISNLSLEKKVNKKISLLKSLVESTIKPTEGDLPMTIPAPVKDSETSALTVSENGTIHFQDKKHTKASLKKALATWAENLRKEKKTPNLQISADPNSKQQIIIDLLNIIRECNIKTVSFSDNN